MSLDSLIPDLQSKLQGLDLDRTIKLDLGDDGAIVIDGSSNPPAITKGDGPADVTLSLSSDDLRQMLAGDLNPQMAFMAGKLQIDGDMALAMKLGQALA